jgi:hypothetical protein
VNAYPHIERRESGPAYLDRSDARPVLSIHRQMAEERYTNDLYLLADWIHSADESREDSDYFGQISSAELVRLCFGGKTNEQQSKAALTELRKRYLEDNKSRIAFDAARIA